MGKVLPHVRPDERVWLMREVKTDGCELWSCNALWVHDPTEAQRLKANVPRNIPERPKPGPPPRQGPLPAPGACCLPALGSVDQCLQTICSSAGNSRWPQGCRPGCQREEDEQKDMPEIVEWPREQQELENHDEAAEDGGPKLIDLWEAYGEYGGPSVAARSLRGAGHLATKQKRQE